MKRALIHLAVLAASLLNLPLAKADTAGIRFLDAGPELNNATGYSLGYSFLANTDLTVTALGYFDGGGLREVHQVGLYSGSGLLLAETSVDASGWQDGFFRYTSVTPLTLKAGQTYQVIGNSGLLDSYTWGTQGLVVNPIITLEHDVFAMGNTLQFGTRTENIDAENGGAFFGANLELASSTPEPGSILLLCSGLPGVVLLAKRRRRVVA